VNYPPINEDEFESFLNYVKTHYSRMVKLALEIYNELPPEKPYRHPRTLATILEKLLSPVVYLYDKFDILPVEEKIKYATKNYKEKLEKLKQEAEQKAKQIFNKKEGEKIG